MLRVNARLSRNAGNNGAASNAPAAPGNGGSSSHSTATSAAASSACARVPATTAATASPCHVARSTANACCGADFNPAKCPNTPTHGEQTPASSAAVTTRTTPGIAAAAEPSIPTIPACAYGLRTNATCTIRAAWMSSTYCPCPRSSRRAFGRGTLCPI